MFEFEIDIWKLIDMSTEFWLAESRRTQTLFIFCYFHQIYKNIVEICNLKHLAFEFKVKLI